MKKIYIIPTIMLVMVFAMAISVTAKPQQPFCKADFDESGKVDWQDFLVFGDQWLDEGENLSADFNEDGIVDNKDFTKFSAFWLKDTTKCWK